MFDVVVLHDTDDTTSLMLQDERARNVAGMVPLLRGDNEHGQPETIWRVTDLEFAMLMQLRLQANGFANVTWREAITDVVLE